MNINATLLGQMITFALFVWFTMRFVWPPLQKALNDRRETIIAGLAEAEKGRRSLEEAALEVSEQLKKARAQAATVVEEAHRRATLIIDEAKKEAREEQQRELAKAKVELQQMVYAAKDSLKEEVASFVLLAAERVIERTIDKDDHARLFTDVIAEL